MSERNRKKRGFVFFPLGNWKGEREKLLLVVASVAVFRAQLLQVLNGSVESSDVLLDDPREVFYLLRGVVEHGRSLR